MNHILLKTDDLKFIFLKIRLERLILMINMKSFKKKYVGSIFY